MLLLVTAASAAVLAIAASDLRPAVGQPVRLTASWAGPLPAGIAWRGVDTALGAEARVVPRAAGPLLVHADDATITLDVQPAGNAGAPLVQADARSLPAVEAASCRDDRYPALAGAWVAWCSTTGRVDRATHLGTRAEVSLSAGDTAPGLGPDAVLAADLGLWRLPEPTPVPDQTRVGTGSVGPPATDGTHGVFAWANRVEAFALTERQREQTEAAPLPGYPTALAWPFAAWVESGGETGEDVWMRDTTSARIPLARTLRNERLVVGSGRWLAWVDEAGVYVQDTTRGERRAYPASTGFVFGPSLWGPVACWEDRAALRDGTGDIDVRCSDGVTVARPGHQRAPSRWGPWLLFREAGQMMVATASELVLDDDDPRAEGGGNTVAGGWRGAHRDAPVAWSFDWPAEGWRVDRWDGAAWVPGEALAVGPVTVSNPSGDAVRLRPVDGAAR
jgi:hypothetical protein